MCQRKIIAGENQYVVPLMNGCNCPHIKEIRDIDRPPEVGIKSPLKFYRMPLGCYDIHTQLQAEMPGMHVVYRHCECGNPTGHCMKLDPLEYEQN